MGVRFDPTVGGTGTLIEETPVESSTAVVTQPFEQDRREAKPPSLEVAETAPQTPLPSVSVLGSFDSLATAIERGFAIDTRDPLQRKLLGLYIARTYPPNYGAADLIASTERYLAEHPGLRRQERKLSSFRVRFVSAEQLRPSTELIDFARSWRAGGLALCRQAAANIGEWLTLIQKIEGLKPGFDLAPYLERFPEHPALATLSKISGEPKEQLDRLRELVDDDPKFATLLSKKLRKQLVRADENDAPALMDEIRARVASTAVFESLKLPPQIDGSGGPPDPIAGVFVPALLSYVQQLDSAGKSSERIRQLIADAIHDRAMERADLGAICKETDTLTVIDRLRRALAERTELLHGAAAWFEGSTPNLSSFGTLLDWLGVKEITGQKSDAGAELSRLESVALEHAGSAVKERLLRPLSLAEKPHRGTLGDDCSSRTYPTFALHPDVEVLTLTHPGDHSNKGHVTLVFGTATEDGTKIAFIDKVQNISKRDLAWVLEGCRKIAAEQGYAIALPERVGDHNGISNVDETRDALASILSSKCETDRLTFVPHHPVPEHMDKLYSRAHKRLSVRILKPDSIDGVRYSHVDQDRQAIDTGELERFIKSAGDVVRAKNQRPLEYIAVVGAVRVLGEELDHTFEKTLAGWLSPDAQLDPRVSASVRHQAATWFLEHKGPQAFQAATERLSVSHQIHIFDSWLQAPHQMEKLRAHPEYLRAWHIPAAKLKKLAEQFNPAQAVDYALRRQESDLAGDREMVLALANKLPQGSPERDLCRLISDHIGRNQKSGAYRLRDLDLRKFSADELLCLAAFRQIEPRLSEPQAIAFAEAWATSALPPALHAEAERFISVTSAPVGETIARALASGRVQSPEARRRCVELVAQHWPKLLGQCAKGVPDEERAAYFDRQPPRSHLEKHLFDFAPFLIGETVPIRLQQTLRDAYAPGGSRQLLRDVVAFSGVRDESVQALLRRALAEESSPGLEVWRAASTEPGATLEASFLAQTAKETDAAKIRACLLPLMEMRSELAGKLWSRLDAKSAQSVARVFVREYDAARLLGLATDLGPILRALSELDSNSRLRATADLILRAQLSPELAKQLAAALTPVERSDLITDWNRYLPRKLHKREASLFGDTVQSFPQNESTKVFMLVGLPPEMAGDWGRMHQAHSLIKAGQDPSKARASTTLLGLRLRKDI